MSEQQGTIEDIIHDDEYTYFPESRVKCASLEQRCDRVGVEVVTDTDGVARKMCTEHALGTLSKHTRLVRCPHCEGMHGIFRTSDKDMRRVQCPYCWVWHGV